jgi:hypothetical protein
MKRLLVVCVAVAFLGAGCKDKPADEKKDEKKTEEKKVEEKKVEPAAPAEEKAEEKVMAPEEKAEEKVMAPEEKVEAPAEEKVEVAVEGGEALWVRSCEHAVRIIMASDEFKDVPPDTLEQIKKEMPGDCLKGLRKASSPEESDRSAKCMLAIEKFTPEAFMACEPKRPEGEAVTPPSEEQPKVEEPVPATEVAPPAEPVPATEVAPPAEPVPATEVAPPAEPAPAADPTVNTPPPAEPVPAE